MEVADAAAVVAGYLIGSIDFGVIVPRLAGVDIYGAGSGNPGTTNVLRTMGRGAAAGVLLGDLLKGFAAALIGWAVGGDVVGFAAGFAATLGHCFPVWHHFKGGKGVAAAGGAALWLAPVLAVILIGVWGAMVAVTKRASIASITIGALFLPGLAVCGHRGWSLVWGGAIALLILTIHHANIRRLITGSENTIGGS